MKVDSKMEEALAYLKSKEIEPTKLSAYSFAKFCTEQVRDFGDGTPMELLGAWEEDASQYWVPVYAQEVREYLD
jgi:hypothetical protein